MAAAAAAGQWSANAKHRMQHARQTRPHYFHTLRDAHSVSAGRDIGPRRFDHSTPARCVRALWPTSKNVQYYNDWYAPQRCCGFHDDGNKVLRIAGAAISERGTFCTAPCEAAAKGFASWSCSLYRFIQHVTIIGFLLIYSHLHDTRNNNTNILEISHRSVGRLWYAKKDLCSLFMIKVSFVVMHTTMEKVTCVPSSTDFAVESGFMSVCATPQCRTLLQHRNICEYS